MPFFTVDPIGLPTCPTSGVVKTVSMSRNTKEYRTFLKAKSELVLALAMGRDFEFKTLGAELYAEGLITEEDREMSRSLMVPCEEWVAGLVSRIANEIERDPVKYHTFVRILALAKKRDTYGGVLRHFVSAKEIEIGSSASSTVETGLQLIIRVLCGIVCRGGGIVASSKLFLSIL